MRAACGICYGSEMNHAGMSGSRTFQGTGEAGYDYFYGEKGAMRSGRVYLASLFCIFTSFYLALPVMMFVCFSVNLASSISLTTCDRSCLEMRDAYVNLMATR